jgi:hypothetical protein
MRNLQEQLKKAFCFKNGSYLSELFQVRTILEKKTTIEAVKKGKIRCDKICTHKWRFL